MTRLIESHDAALTASGGGNSMNRGVVGVEETALVGQFEYRGGIDGVDSFLREIVGEEAGLVSTLIGQFGIGDSRFEFASNRYSVPDQNDFHERSD